MNKNFSLKLIPLGKVIKTHGIKGELKVSVYNQKSETLVDGLKVWFNIDNKFESYKLKTVRGSIKNTIIELDRIDCKNQASFLTNKELLVSRDDFPILKNKDDFYLNDLIGMKIVNNKDISYGIVIDILNFPSNDIFLIKFKGKEIMIPNIDNFIEFFDFKNNIIRVKNIKSLLDL